MDEIDKYIKKIVTKKIEEPPSFEKAIREALYSEKFYKRMRKRKIIKTISTACATIVLTSGVAVGGFIAYEKVWKEPKQYTYEELKNTIAQSEVPEEEKANLISEEDAKNKALEIVNNLGYENQEITKIELQQNMEEYLNEVFYEINMIEKNYNINIKINALNGELKSLENTGILENEENNTEISKEQAEQITSSIYNKIGINENEYKLSYCNKEKIAYNGKSKEVWNVESNKEYHGIINPYEGLKVNFIINSEEVKISSIVKIQDGAYEDNPEVITEQEAKNIAIEKEKEFTHNEILEVKAIKGIEKINNFIIELENNIINMNEKNTNGNNHLYFNKLNQRNVWLVELRHKEENINITPEQRILNKDKIFYIDITTGEIIGGRYAEKSQPN